ncbi:peptide-methionine (S)-S-oxide reductase MsrA [Acinetobacter rathckeae]|uniref:peptide-methionine (S)-S-oxide reductase MsrA n=1 Tax=Acinetobacter rathckeae TaxID=2605272 RepID=UPI0018A2C1D3|nr:peptide-methionine (S)-S-oxide reductase MsrA [Acinetobacter rathckeae]MBF7686652.1 peptide-methionine (S)-S-oxide reductase MsrA [Acinetobacter rathckeae]MBF7696469.1 peptide-methionine (S)-S-oxide reductase MsrA [Acinetobacter rathckeae]
MQKAMFGGGCFWCIESVLLELKGVHLVESGYAGGKTTDPTYEQVCTGTTGHAEVVYIEYDEQVITYQDLLNVFFGMHDPTTLNRQGNDVGTQYRSVIFFYDELQKTIATTMVHDLITEGINVVTEIEPVSNYYKAEEYHQNFYAKNPEQGYCNFAIPPKLLKLRQKFQHLLKA